MAVARLHENEIFADAALARRLIVDAFPAWAELPVIPVEHGGTDNWMFRLGDALAVRLPRRSEAVPALEKEARWLPSLAPLLPLAVPEPIALGGPTDAYPAPFAVCRWLPGESAVTQPLGDLDEAAVVLGGFVEALGAIDAAGGPPPGAHNSFRGVPLRDRDAATRAAIARLDGLIDTRAALDAWQRALEAPVHTGAPRWLHGDIHPGNLLVEAERATAVIDFGCLGVGDPAADLAPAWSLLTPGTREAFRRASGADDAAWERGRGWALSFGLIALPYYLGSGSSLVAIARRAIAERVRG